MQAENCFPYNQVQGKQFGTSLKNSPSTNTNFYSPSCGRISSIERTRFPREYGRITSLWGVPCLQTCAANGDVSSRAVSSVRCVKGWKTAMICCVYIYTDSSQLVLLLVQIICITMSIVILGVLFPYFSFSSRAVPQSSAHPTTILWVGNNRKVSGQRRLSAKKTTMTTKVINKVFHLLCLCSHHWRIIQGSAL